MNDSNTQLGKVRIAQGGSCSLCGTKYLRLYAVGDASICHKCFQRTQPALWSDLQAWKDSASTSLSFEEWTAAGRPTTCRMVRLAVERLHPDLTCPKCGAAMYWTSVERLHRCDNPECRHHVDEPRG